MLDRQSKIYQRRGEHMSYIDMQNELPKMKAYLPWLKETDSKAIKYACRNLDSGFKRFFKKQGGYPKYKSKHRGKQSYKTEHPTTVGWEPKAVTLPKVGKLKTRDKRILPNGAKICNATVSLESDNNFYVSVSFKYEADIDIKSIQSVIGLDFKVSSLYVNSNGNRLDMPIWYKDSLYKLKLEQRKLKHKKGYQKGEPKSNRYKHQKAMVNKLHHHIASQRKDFLQKQSTAIAKLYDTICIEDLSIKDMYISDDVNKKKHNINRSYANDGWYMFTQMLAYKANYRGGRVIKVEKTFPQRKCVIVVKQLFRQFKI